MCIVSHRVHGEPGVPLGTVLASKGACKLEAQWEDEAPEGAWRARSPAGVYGDMSDAGELMAFHC